jgi:ATP-dependent DNA helicase RecQ
MQFQAGYLIDAIAKIISTFRKEQDPSNTQTINRASQLNGLLQHVTTFNVQFPENYEPDYQNLPSVLCVANNILVRGLPTKSPVFLEELFEELEYVKRDNNSFELNFPNLTKDISFDTVFELLHLIEPGLGINRDHYAGNPGSNLEWEFLRKHPFLIQILESQRDFSTINQKLKGGRTVDFSFTSPYLHWNEHEGCFQNKSRIFEVDGPHHTLSEYRFYDKYRDAVAEEENFSTLRFSQNEIRDDNTDFEQLVGRKIYKIFSKNFERNRDQFLHEYTLIFVPLAVARIQKTIIEALLADPSLLDKSSIKLWIVERDVPCGAIALRAFQEVVANLNDLLEDHEKFSLPQFELTVFPNSDWVMDKRLHLSAEKRGRDYFATGGFDLLIDHSIFRRENIYQENDFLDERAIKVRSAHFTDTSWGQKRRVYCSGLLPYKSVVRKLENGRYQAEERTEDAMNYFVRNIFRKKEYRPGQLAIISRALQKKPVIGLLPTGGGKSLAFQLPAFLQPGLCLIIDPIKSLMEDQVRVLKDSWIDCCDFINSNIGRIEKNKRLVEFRYGESMFLFVSPERFVMRDFRQTTSTINSSEFGLAFSFCVIDEVHCVSEWGHDFRSTYLMLGKNAQEYTQPKDPKSKVALIGLTATASFDVLADVERELQIQHEDVASAIVEIENTIRPELFFRVIDVTGKSRIDALNMDFERLGANLNKLNNEELREKSIAHHRETFTDLDIISDDILITDDDANLKDFKAYDQNDFSAIVFCPVKGKNGVDGVFENLNSTTKGYFYADDSHNINQEVQRHFLNFTTGRTQHMVCTKAFGMGIDKKDIRSTYHYGYSSSLESLVQEAGRAGRDKKIAESNILLSVQKHFRFDVPLFFEDNQTVDLLTKPATRKIIRRQLEQIWDNTQGRFQDVRFGSREEIIEHIESKDFGITNSTDAESLRSLLLQGNDTQGRYVNEVYEDRSIHDFFHSISFKSIDAEKSQIFNLFYVKEFQHQGLTQINVDGQSTLKETFEQCEEDIFPFTVTAKKEYPDSALTVCTHLVLDPEAAPPHGNQTILTIVKNGLKFSNGFTDFLLRLEERGVVNLSALEERIVKRLRFYYNRDRNETNTGRLIYRLHCLGLLEDYVIEYNLASLHYCKFRKLKNIEAYLKILEQYFRRYLSENGALKQMQMLNERLTKPTLVENLIECLYYLSEFSYKEIAGKRKRATDEIESILNISVEKKEFKADWFKQNLFIKEEIYFYFNAKYARPEFSIEGIPYSLLDDHKLCQNGSMPMNELLFKYIDVYTVDPGTEQNNYKHMIGSCKKIIRALAESELNGDWSLRLLKSFAMYSVNNTSYISEANDDLEKGFENLYEDDSFHKGELSLVEDIFERYFKELLRNLNNHNQSLEDVQLIMTKLLLKMQVKGVENILNRSKFLTE